MLFSELLTQLKLVIGLGNIGTEYERTRHNAGFIFVDYLHDLLQASNWKQESKFKAWVATISHSPETAASSPLIAKPTTMMNNSGEAIREIIDYYHINPDQVLVAHDDMDIQLGSYKLQFGHGPKVHNGIASVNQHLGTENYYRLRIGVENRAQIGNKTIPGIRYSLERFPADEHSMLIETINQIITSN